ncbi:YciI family protein [Microbacterium gorillae]|uniref:hypothetical protein n=1 Tax=Microbacterium gorillae TaxID=1231063 RepID=UPI00058D2040|nr:hypothetical protein [Microbacterium gorillae]
MTDSQYLFLLYGGDWDSDAAAAGEDAEDLADEMAVHGEFAAYVAGLGAEILGGEALHSLAHGGSVRRGPEGRRSEDAVWTEGAAMEATEVIGGFYIVRCDAEQARLIALAAPTSRCEWREIFPTG